MDKKIVRKLEKTRALLIQTGLKYGFQNKKTIMLSKRLDRIMNKYFSQCTFPK